MCQFPRETELGKNRFSESDPSEGEGEDLKYSYRATLWSLILKYSFKLICIQILTLNFASRVLLPSKNYFLSFLLSFFQLTRDLADKSIAFIKFEITKMSSNKVRWRSSWSASGGARSTNANNSTRSRSLTFFSSLKWTPIPLSLGFALLCYQHYKRVINRDTKPADPEQKLASDLEITCYRMLPLRSISRAWGWIHNMDLPKPLREPFLSWYIKRYNCDITEAEVEDLKSYKNLGEFFRRGLKQCVRPISENSLVSPADGTIIHYGKVDCDQIEQVKGVTYSLPAFFGPYNWKKENETEGSGTCSLYSNSLLQKSDTSLFHCVIYLAPGDYHRFHSPAEWNIEFRRHFSGELFSVRPSIASWISGLFSLNERSVYIGNWEHGFFSVAAIGATNVGSIRVYKDEDLNTNIRGSKKFVSSDMNFAKSIKLEKGEGFGEFNLGSTIVIIFEAPKNFNFSFDCCCKIKMGQSLLSEISENDNIKEKCEKIPVTQYKMLND